MTPLLSLAGVAVARGDRLLFEGLDLAIAAGEFVHLKGRNGAGKTSLLEALCGLRPLAAGRFDVRPEPSGFHWIGHRNALNPGLSPLENLSFWCGLNGIDSAAAAPALTRLGLQAQRHRPCGQLSTGQRRRAALARLVAAPRRGWLLDEPLAGLDVAGLAMFGDLLSGHLAEGGWALITSHQPLPALSGLRVCELQPLRNGVAA